MPSTINRKDENRAKRRYQMLRRKVEMLACEEHVTTVYWI